MKLTRNHVYVLLIAAAASAWAFDHFVLGGGAPSPAAAAELLVAKTPAPAPAMAQPRSAAPAALTLTQRFDNAPDDPLVPDAFAPPAAWLPAQVRTRETPPDPAAIMPAAPAVDLDAFRQAHKLTAVFRMGGAAGMAVVDGQMVPMGKTLDGFALVALTDTSATFRHNGSDIALSIDATLPAGTTSSHPLVKSDH